MEADSALDLDANDAVSQREARKAYNAAIRMLARREHSVVEVRDKLCRKFPDLSHAEVDAITDLLIGDGYLSDERFAEMLIRSRIRRGYGPFYILQELKTKGLASELIDAQFSSQEVDWYALAKELVARKHPQADQDLQAWAKAVRFLQRRGFSGDCVSHAVGERP